MAVRVYSSDWPSASACGPCATTTLSTCVAMLPLLVFPQEGEFWTGMAATVTGGLLVATLLAPLATLALVQLLDE